MEKPRGNFLYRNLANAVSILGVLPLALLFLEDGYRYLVPLIIFNNVRDDLDGIWQPNYISVVGLVPILPMSVMSLPMGFWSWR